MPFVGTKYEVNIITLPSENISSRHMDSTKKEPIDHVFKVLKKCTSKFDWLIYEMLFIWDIEPSLNTQTDSIRAKLFTWHLVII